MTRIITEIDTAVKEITSGNIIALPAETVYGLGANALNENAVIKIFETKQRPVFNPLIVHLYSQDDFEKYAADIPDDVYKLADKFSPGPISFILNKKKLIPDIVTSGNDTVALRIPSHKMFREVLKESNVPVCAPSANRSGRISPTTAGEVLKELNGKINFILDGEKCSIGIESTVVRLSDGEIEILRKGYITSKEIEKVTGKTIKKNVEKNSGKIISPGLLESHYAPQTRLYIVDDNSELKNLAAKNTGILDFNKYNSSKEIALNLFSDLRKLDEMKFDFIICKKLKDEGIGSAINDRLERASSGRCIMVNGQLTFQEK